MKGVDVGHGDGGDGKAAILVNVTAVDAGDQGGGGRDRVHDVQDDPLSSPTLKKQTENGTFPFCLRRYMPDVF